MISECQKNSVVEFFSFMCKIEDDSKLQAKFKHGKDIYYNLFARLGAKYVKYYFVFTWKNLENLEFFQEILHFKEFHGILSKTQRNFKFKFSF